MLIGTIFYAGAFAAAYAWALAWILERRDRKYGQGAVHSADALGAGLYVFAFVFFSNLLIVSTKPAYAALYAGALITALAGFCLYRESVYKMRARRVDHRRRAEVRLLEHHIAKDPGNASYYERLSEVYENLGDKKKALETARMAAKMDPTVRNHWRLKSLEG
jgi:cytochrome c-type biogenesis protein CcmH/NrfG